MCCGSAVSCDQTPGSKMRICPESFRTCANSNWTTCRNICSCCGLESVRGQVRMPSFGIRRRLPIGSKITARLDNKSCACGVVVVAHVRVQMCVVFVLGLVVRSDSSDDGAWSLTAPQVGMLCICCI